MPLTPDRGGLAGEDVQNGVRWFTVEPVHGCCAPFCANDDDAGADVEDHGVACASWSSLWLENLTTRTGASGHIDGKLVVPYLHGLYSSWDVATVERRGYVQLSVDAGTVDSEVDICLTPEQARTIAAGLYRLAAELERAGGGIGTPQS
ncbi:hypothetical protein ACIA49_03480 [Kribbella sp. NPDC051587]|uniref:hypothetical protein n=1 Tax=Kribbella sp. NPDC051587 TaxID=3364119 RepID=UPI0037AB89D1